MKFSYNWLKDFLPQLPPPQQLAEILTLKSFEVERVEKINNDHLLEINLTPNRYADCSGHLGLAREISALLNLKIKEPKISLKENKESVPSVLLVKIENKNDCPRYSARIIFDVEIKPSPSWLKERLEICGLQSINNVVDATNYIMLQTGQPLHAFDYDKLTGTKIKSIIVRRAKNGENILTLDNNSYQLNEEILLIADREKPLAIAGIKGGKVAEIDEKTKRIVIESANFDPVLIHRASRFLNLKTDASLRFERGLSPVLTTFALNQVAFLIQKITGGKILKGIVDIYPQKLSRKILGFDLKKFHNFAGLEISKTEIKKIFQKLRLKIIKETKTNLFLEIPPERIDLEIFEDLAEEILRFYDYNQIPEKPPFSILVPAVKNEEIEFRQQFKKFLTSLGLNEVYNYSFISKKDLLNWQINPEEVLALENPASEETAYLRPTLLINLLKNSGSNFRFFKEVKIFEIGKVFQKAPFSPYEEWRVAGLISRKEKDPLLFLEMKGILEKLFEFFGFWDYKFNDLENNLWLLTGRSAEIKSDQESFGFIGELSPNLTQIYNDGYQTVAFELDLLKIMKAIQEEREYQPLPKYPAVIRDLSILVNKEIRVSEILNIIYQSETKILRDVDLFDIYEGENLPEEKKSLSFHLIFQAEDHTLTNEEVGEALAKIIANLQEKLKAEIRS